MEVIRQKSVEQLFRAILSLENLEECYAFFEDVCTVKEILEIAQRFDVASQLHAGFNYGEVNKRTGASTATISRVKKCLMYGNSGYRLALDRLSGAEKEEV